MIDHPFRIFDPYRDHIDVRFYAKADERLNEEGFVSLRQVHGNHTEILRSPSRREKNADGVITDQTGLTLTLRVADCQAFVIYAPNHHVIGLLHAGWKGLVNGAIPQFFETLKREWGIGGAEAIVGAGPSLCTGCAEFTDPVAELAGIDPRFFHGRNADLRGIADDQLMACGVRTENMERHPDCTKCKKDLYWTYRGGDREAVINGSTNVLTCMLKKRQ